MGKIDSYERRVLDAFDRGELKSVATKAEVAKFKSVARATAIKDRRINIRLSSGDLSDHRISPTGTPGWMTVDTFGAAPLGRDVRVRGGVRNLFDALYRVHGSGLDGPGVTAWLAVEFGR